MKKILIINAFLAFSLVLPFFAQAQNAIKIRISGNSTTFRGEPQGDKNIFPMLDYIFEEDSSFADFNNKGNVGLGGEVMFSLSTKAWIGLELSKSNFYGNNDNPPPYNFQYTDDYQLQIKTFSKSDPQLEKIYQLKPLYKFPLEYNTSLINLLANFRYYISDDGRFLPFLKLHTGVSFIATELGIRDINDWPTQELRDFIDTEGYEIVDSGLPILFSRGTNNSKQGRVPALNYGIGAGFEIQINEKINFYADYTLSWVNSNILDGIPNYDFIEPKLEPVNISGSLGQLSFGLCYKLGQNLNLIGGGGGGSKGGGKTGRQHPYLPFYEIKREK